MEYDRYQQNHKLFIAGIICLLVCLSFVFFSLYILPYLLWGLNYSVPYMVVNLVHIFHDDSGYSRAASNFIVWLLFFVPGLIAGLISYLISNHIENKIYGLDVKSQAEENSQEAIEHNANLKESASFGLQILLLMVLIVVAVFMGYYLIQYI